MYCLVSPKIWLTFLCAIATAKVQSVDLKVTNTGEDVILGVIVYFNDSCGYQRTVEWQQVPRVEGTNVIIRVNKTEHRKWGGVCLPVMVPYSYQYQLPLPVGAYTLVVQEFTTQVLEIRDGLVWVETWHQVHSLPFRVHPLPPELRIRVSEVETCWQSSRGQWYRLEYRLSMTTNNWLPVTSWLPGTGGELCVKDPVPKTGESQRYYRVVSTNSLPQ